MQTRQAKTHSQNTASTKAAEAPQKAAVSAASASRVPAWATGMNDLIPAGLALQNAGIVPGMQAKLAISQPNDPAEQEADQVAEQVMRMPDTTPTLIERQGKDEVSAPARKALQRQATQQTSENAAPPIVNQVLSSGNSQPLDAGTRAFMEPRFGTDFSDVRVHTGGQAAESAQSINALAYTVSNDVVFGRGQYQPETSEGQKLLAHELTHVVQQSSTSSAAIIHRAKSDHASSTGTHSEPLQIFATTFDDAAKNLADILVTQNLHDPARIIVINGANLHVFDELGNPIPGASGFRVVHDVQWPAGVFRQVPQDPSRRLHAIVRSASGGYFISPQPAPSSTHVDFSRDISDQAAFNSALSGAHYSYYVIPKIAAPPPSSESATPPSSEAPEFARFVPTGKANLPAWPAAVIPLTPQVATVHSTGSFMMHMEKNQGVNMVDRVTNLMEPTNFRWEVLKLDDQLHVSGQQDVTKLAGIKEGYARRIRDVRANQETLLGDHPERQSVPEQVARRFIAVEMGNAEMALAMAGQTAMSLINTVTGSPDNPNIENIIDVPWDKPGDYFVRCLATPIYDEKASNRRATSVAGVMVSIYDIAELASSSLLSAEEERAAAQKAAAADEEDLAELKRKQAMGEGDPVEQDIRIHILQARIDYEHEKITAAGDARAMKVAELNFTRTLITYFTGPDAPKGKKEAQAKVNTWLKELRTKEKELSDLLERADHRLGTDAKQTAVMSAVFVDEVTGNRYPLTFTIGEHIRINADELEVRIADITAEQGRVFSGSGTGWAGKGRAEAWQNAMRDLRRNLNRGRGWLAFHSPPPYASLPLDLPNPMQLQIAGLDQLKEMVDDAAHAATLLALLAAPFTEGASLEILAVLAPIQATSSLYNIVNRAMYDDLRLDESAVMDFINIATFGLGHIAEAGQFASKSVQIAVASGKVALRLLEAGTYIVISYQTYQQLMAEGPADEDPRARQRRRLMALLNLMEAASIPVASRLWPPGAHPSTRPSTEAHPTEKPAGGGQSPREGSREAGREGTPVHEGGRPHLTAAPPELVAVLGDLQARVPVEVDPSLAPGTVRVHYEQDLNGLIREIKVRVGREASARDVELHLPTIRMMNRYSGFSGRVRLLLEQLQRWINKYSAPPVGSRAWEAKLELEKLPPIIRDRVQRLESGSLDPATEQRLLTELDNLQAQLAEHARTLDTMDLDPGSGFVAAEGVSKGKQKAAEELAGKTSAFVPGTADPGIARQGFRALYDAIKRGINTMPQLRADAKFAETISDITRMSGAERTELETAFEQVKQLVKTGQEKSMDDASLLGYIDRWAINRDRPGFQAKFFEEMNAWKPLTAEQQQALNALNAQKSVVKTLYGRKDAAEEELVELVAKKDKSAEDFAEIKKLGEELSKLDPIAYPPKRQEGIGQIKEAEGRLAYLEKQAARTQLTLYDRLRAATPSPAARERTLKGITTDQVGPLKTPAGPVGAEHIVSVREIADMDGFADLLWEDQKAITDMRENLIAMDRSANSSKGDRTWRSWDQASNFYGESTIASMARREDIVRSIIKAEIENRLAKLKAAKP